MESPLIVACLVVAVVEFCKAHVIEEVPAFGETGRGLPDQGHRLTLRRWVNRAQSPPKRPSGLDTRPTRLSKRPPRMCGVASTSVLPLFAHQRGGEVYKSHHQRRVR